MRWQSRKELRPLFLTLIYMPQVPNTNMWRMESTRLFKDSNFLSVRYKYDDSTLVADEFIELFFANWPRLRTRMDAAEIKQAIAKTINVTARDESKLVGCLRVLSDGYLMSVVCEVIVDPHYRDTDIAGQLVAIVSEEYPRNLLLATHRVDPESMKPWGWQSGYPSFVLKKELPTSH